jgi:hypothetical protein
MQLNPATLQVAHANRTLVVSVDKPDALIVAEEAWRDQRKKLGLQKDGDVQCPQQWDKVCALNPNPSNSTLFLFVAGMMRL